VHRLNRSDDVPEPDGPASVDGSAGGGGDGAARVGEVGDDGGDDSVRGASGPWGRPLGPMDARHPANHQRPNRAGDYHDAVLVVFFSSLLLPFGSMTRALGPV
jgi:hypothetical protein